MRPPPPPPSRTPRPGLTVSYDWTRFGRHRLRAPDGIVVDSPLGPAGRGWLATTWPATDSDVGWARLLWQPDNTRGGWTIPTRLAGGDVLEFGADRPDRAVRWYGIVDTYDAVEWLTIQGPYPDPWSAYDHAQVLLAPLRYHPPLRRPATRRPACTRLHGRRW